MDKILGFGLLGTASAPGGGGRNIWTFLLGGDLDLSITMTFFSKAIALGKSPSCSPKEKSNYLPIFDRSSVLITRDVRIENIAGFIA
jgi:hypothetical protein